MLKDFDVDRIAAPPAIVRPDVALPETQAVDRLLRQAGSGVGEFLRVAQDAAQALDNPGLAAK
jgi:hypothetical protein